MPASASRSASPRSFFFIQTIYDFLTAPAIATLPEGSKLIYTQPTEAFSLYITISLISGAVFAAPFIMYQVWMFIAPGLYANEKKFVIPFVLFSTLGFLAGAAFNHYVAYPFIMIYFASFNTPNLTYMPQLSEVFGLYVKMLLGLGVIFQMPTVVFFLAKIKIVIGALPDRVSSSTPSSSSSSSRRWSRQPVIR